MINLKHRVGSEYQSYRLAHLLIFSLIIYLFISIFLHLYLIGLSKTHPNGIFPSPTSSLTHSSTIQQTMGGDIFFFKRTLRKKRILMEVTTVGMRQFSLFESVIDSVRDICECGAYISLHIITSSCDPMESASRCKLSSEDEKILDNYPEDIINQLNEKLRCIDIDGNVDALIHIKSSKWGKQMVNFHRKIFYDNIDGNFDVYIHTEEDELIRPTNILAFLNEMEKIRLLVGDDRLADYSIGFVRYENQRQRDDMRRVVWEFDWWNDGEYELPLINHTGLEGKYFTTPPPYHHQGMFMATRYQLLKWKTRLPDCHFDRISQRPGYHRERISGAVDLYDKDICNVTQLLPLSSFDDLLIHHLADKNNQRSPRNIISTLDLHRKRMNALLLSSRNSRLNKVNSSNFQERLWIDSDGNYNGIKVFQDEDNKTIFKSNISNYKDYVSRGGILNFIEVTHPPSYEYYDDDNSQVDYETE